MQSFPTDVNAQDTNQSNTTTNGEQYKRKQITETVIEIKVLVVGTGVGVERVGEGEEAGK